MGVCGCVCPCAVWRFPEERLLKRRTTYWHTFLCCIRPNHKQRHTCYVATTGHNDNRPMSLGACVALFDASWTPTDPV